MMISAGWAAILCNFYCSMALVADARVQRLIVRLLGHCLFANFGIKKAAIFASIW